MTDKNIKCSSIIREFALNTSTHGLPGIARSESILNRIFWTVSFISFTGVLIYFVCHAILQYFTYPTNTVLSIVSQQSQQFPAVTVCNYSPYRVDLLMEAVQNYSASLNRTLSIDINNYNQSEIEFVFNFIIDLVNQNNLSSDFMFSLKSLMVSCSYNGYSCTVNDFISFISPTYGLCYTFNALLKNGTDEDIRLTDENGNFGTLKLRFYTHNHLYFPLVTKDVSASMVVVVHHNREAPLVDFSGMSYSPGLAHRVFYRKRTNDVLPSPYSDCTKTKDAAMEAMYTQYNGTDYIYSQTVCQLICSQTFTYEQCGCVNPTQWNVRYVRLPNTQEVIKANACYFGNQCFRAASRNLSSSTLRKEYCGHCTQACSTTDFMVTPSSAKAPTEYFAVTTKSFVEATHLPLAKNWSLNWRQIIDENYVAIDVICGTLLVESSAQEASLSPFDVLSSVGGYSGLWIGISFLSIMEFIEMIFRLVHCKIFRMMNRF